MRRERRAKGRATGASLAEVRPPVDSSFREGEVPIFVLGQRLKPVGEGRLREICSCDFSRQRPSGPLFPY